MKNATYPAAPAAARRRAPAGSTVGEYLLTRLEQLGIDHVFGVPGDFILGFLNQALRSRLKYVGTCNELNAAYAADGYARLKGIGALAVTHGVGELSAMNGVAGSFAERVPVVVITGSPSSAAFRSRPLLHHTLGDYMLPLRMYEKITAAAGLLTSGETAPAEIDRVLKACLAARQPVYLSLPSDVSRMECAAPGPFPSPEPEPADAAALREAAAEALAMLRKAAKPVVLADLEVVRYGLRKELADLLRRSGFPYATMILGKAVLSEKHPQFIGYYEGARSREYVRRRVETSDCVLQLGALATDLNTGGFTLRLPDRATVCANIRSVRIGSHRYDGVPLGAFLKALAAGLERRPAETLDIQCAAEGCSHRCTAPYSPRREVPLTSARFFDRVSHFLKKDSVVIAETGVSLFSAADMLMPDGASFIGQAFYSSIGYSPGAALGACAAAPARPLVLFIGDGAFQASGQEVSTMLRAGFRPLIFLLNNDGYTTERIICDRPYNDLAPWRYHKLREVYGGGTWMDVRTEGELEEALVAAGKAPGLVFIEVHTGRLDCPDLLRDIGKKLAKSHRLD